MHSVSLKSSPVETVHTFCNLLSEHESNGAFGRGVSDVLEN